MSTSRVLIVSNHARVVGGGEISLLTLVEGLRDTQWEPVVTVPGPGEVSERCNDLGVPTYECPLPSLRRPFNIPAAVRRIRGVIDRVQPRLLHANGSRAMFYAGIAGRTTGRPVIWHIRILARDPRLDAVLMRLATGSIAISEAAHERLRGWPRAYQGCRVIPNGLNLAAFAPTRTRSTVRDELGIQQDEILVACVSRLFDFKRHDLLLNALERLRLVCPQLRCIVVGDGPAEAALVRRAHEAGLAKIVVFTGHRTDIADLLGASDLFVLPSPVEAFGRVVIEAMALALPVVAANVAGPKEIIESGKTGVLVQPGNAEDLGDAIEGLCNDPELRVRLGAAARESVERRYSMQRHARDVARYYDDILAPAPGASG